MDIYKALVESSLSLARAKRIKRVCVGIRYTMVEIERNGAGLACTLLPEAGACSELGEDTNFWKSPADIVIKGYFSAHPIEVAVALATINALFNKKSLIKSGVVGDVFSQIEIKPEDEILMVGYFEPVYKKLQGKVKKIWVIEKNWESLTFEISDIVRKVKVAIITSSSLVNKTLHILLEKLKDVREVLLMGPSTPLNPEIFRYTPITWLCGSVVKDSESLLKKVCEGKGAVSFFKSGVLEKINLRVKK